MEVSWLVLACVICLPRISFGVTPVTNCPDYVPENKDLRCQCLLPDNVSGPANFSWSGGGNYFEAPTLDIGHVTRESNATQYTCLMMTTGYTASTVYTLRVAYGPTSENLQILPSHFVTYESQQLILTCSATDTYPPPVYTWYGDVCDNVVGNTCTFRPDSTPGNDTLNVTCLAARVRIAGLEDEQGIVATKSVLLDLSYLPTIKAHTKGDGILQLGDEVSCSFMGNESIVDSIQFECVNPLSPDQDDTFYNTSVSSYITVRSSQVTEEKMECVCNVTWKTKPEFHQPVSTAVFVTGYKAIVTNLTLKNANNHITVNEKDRETLVLSCEAYGRPASKVTMKALGTQRSRSLSPWINDTGQWKKTARVTLSRVTCQDMGVYLCAADNGVGSGDSKIIHLNVKCRPKKLTFNNILNMTKDGISFKLTSFPVPDRVEFSYHEKQGSTTQGKIVAKEMFSFHCKQNTHIHSFVDCMIVPIKVQEESLGFYTATVSNALGSVNISFVIKSKVVPPADHSAVTGLVVGVALLVVIAMVLLIVWRKRSQLARLCARRRPYSLTARSSCPYDVIPMDSIESQPHRPRLPSRHSWPLPQIPEAGVPFSTLSQHDDDEDYQEHEQQPRVSGLLRPPRTSYEPMRQRTGPDSHRYSGLWRSSVLSEDDMFLHLLFENPHTVDAED